MANCNFCGFFLLFVRGQNTKRGGICAVVVVVALVVVVVVVVQLKESKEEIRTDRQTVRNEEEIITSGDTCGRKLLSSDFTDVQPALVEDDETSKNGKNDCCCKMIQPQQQQRN